MMENLQTESEFIFFVTFKNKFSFPFFINKFFENLVTLSMKATPLTPLKSYYQKKKLK